MSARSCGLLVAAVLTCGCLDAAPVAEPQGLPINEGVLGTWVLPGEPDSLVVLGFSDTEYAIEHTFAAGSFYFRGYEVEIDGRRFVQLALIGQAGGVEPPEGGYCLVSYDLDGDELVLRLEGETCHDDEPSRWRRQGSRAVVTPDEPPAAGRQPASEPGPYDRTSFEGDLRVGSVRPLEARYPVSVGGRLAFYPGRDGPGQRVSIQFFGDYVRLDSQGAFDPELASLTETLQHFFHASLSVGVDVLRTSRALLEVRAGPSWIGERTTFSLQGRGDSPYQDVCDLAAFASRCSNEVDFGGHVAVGLHARPNDRWPMTVGIDVAYLTRGQYVMVGTVGLSWRR